MIFLNVQETLDPYVSSIHKEYVPPFDGVKMRFFKGHEILAEVEQLSILEAWKTIPALSSNLAFQGNWFHVSHCLTFWQHENVFLQGLWDTRIKATLLSLSYYTVFWRPEIVRCSSTRTYDV